MLLHLAFHQHDFYTFRGIASTCPSVIARPHFKSKPTFLRHIPSKSCRRILNTHVTRLLLRLYGVQRAVPNMQQSLVRLDLNHVMFSAVNDLRAEERLPAVIRDHPRPRRCTICVRSFAHWSTCNCPMNCIANRYDE